MNSLVSFRGLLGATTGLLSLAAVVSAQEGEEPTQQGDCIKIYASPDGNPNATGLLIDHPVKSLGAALSLAQQEPDPVVIVLLPGIYHADDEAYPYDVPENVSIQGTNATNTVLWGEDSEGNRFDLLTMNHVFWEGVRYEETVIDGVTFSNMEAGLQIFSETGSFRPTISNCVFADGFIGVSMEAVHGAPSDPEIDADTNGYAEHRPKIVNCTFSDLYVGIIDLTMDFFTGVPFGEAEPAVLNGLLVDNTFDLWLIDNLDVMNTGFATATTGPGGQYKAGRVAPTPAPSTAGLAPFVSPATGDFRLLHSMKATLADIGRSDLPLSFANGTVAEDPGTCGMSIFDYDGEVYGNPRVEASEVDLGADEIGNQIVAGYKAWTTTFDTVNNQMTLYLDAAAPLCQLWTQIAPSLDYEPLTLGAPGARADGTIAPGTAGSFGGSLWIDLAQVVLYSTLPVPGSITVPISSPPAGTTRINQQILAQQAGGLELTNLQTYTVEP